jgi:hypothetical protein
VGIKGSTKRKLCAIRSHRLCRAGTQYIRGYGNGDLIHKRNITGRSAAAICTDKRTVANLEKKCLGTGGNGDYKTQRVVFDS